MRRVILIRIAHVRAILKLMMVALILILIFTPISLGVQQGSIAATPPTWGIEVNSYGQLISSKMAVKTEEGFILDNLNSSTSSSAIFRINVFQLPFLEGPLQKGFIEDFTASLLIRSPMPETTPSRFLANDAIERGVSGATYSLFPPRDGYVTFYGKFFPEGARGYIRTVSIYVRNTDVKEHDLHIRFSSAPGEPTVFEEVLQVPGEYEGWRGLTLNKKWDFNSVFPHIYMTDLEGYTAETYPLKFGFSQSDGNGDGFITIASTDNWQKENLRYLIRLVIGDTPEFIDLTEIKLNNNTILKGSPAQYDIFYSFHAVGPNLRIALSQTLIRTENTLETIVPPYTCWDIQYINLNISFNTSRENPFWKSVFSYELMFILFTIEIVFSFVLFKKFYRWLRDETTRFSLILEKTNW